MHVKATREGLAGQLTASGWRIDNAVSFCALPSRKALHRHVRITNLKNEATAIAEVLDVGPWSEADDAYVFRGERPLSESNQRIMLHGTVEPHHTNGAGIDLGEKVWNVLDMQGNEEVDWEFV